jgi:UDP-glucose 4-epimerase
MTKYLITGGAGFIGSHLVDALLAGGDQVVVLDSMSTGTAGNLEQWSGDPNLRIVQGSVLDDLLVDELVYECDAVMHLAAAVGVRLIVEDPLRSFITNVRGSEVVIGASHRYQRKVMVLSSSEIYGKNNGKLSEDSDRILGPPTVARWAYAISKSVDEVLALSYHRERGLPVVVVRLFNTVGPRQSPAYGMVIPRLVQQALEGSPLTVYGDGSQRRCFCHVRDVVRALIGLFNEPGAVGEAFNVGSGEEISIAALAERIIALTGSASTIELVSYERAYETGFEDMARRQPVTTKIRELIGWQPEHNLDDILRDTIEQITAARTRDREAPTRSRAGA